MIEDRQTRVRELREIIERGQYRVDPKAVADALIRMSSGQGMATEYALAA